ncbi:MAG TPA: GlxA family transcriptional regulator [Roseovarius sp.]|nr:GlxA family transcriptional regulator [Roseovarius sp.]
MTRTRHFIFILIEDFAHLAFSNAVEPLRIANLIKGEALYSFSLGAEGGQSVRASNETVTLVNHGVDDLPRCDRLFVLSGLQMRNRITPALLAMLRRERARGSNIGALCSGAYILAKAGFLDGQKCAIHWDYHDSFMEEFPDIPLVRNVFVADEKHITASGGSATADLMLHLIERDHGRDLAVAVADQMVYTAAREATAEQRVSLQSRNGMRNPHLTKAIARMQDHIEDPISPSVIAEDLGISTRQLERLFGRYLNTSPKKYFMELRLERARHLLLQTEMSVTEIACACGFEATGHFARVYKGAYGVTPTGQKAKLG